MKQYILRMWITLMLVTQNITHCSNPSSHAMYNTYAHYYDQLYSAKNYDQETCFLHELLSRHKAHTLLDVGCGTGTHISFLEQLGYTCLGIDINREILDIAKTKVSRTVVQADMRDFELNEQFDAVISMFAVYNHNLVDEDALATLKSIKKHLHKDGILILDLYNPQSSGEKTETYGKTTRVMKWQLDSINKICLSHVTLVSGHMKYASSFPLKIYSMNHIEELPKQCGYKDIQYYDNYTTNPGTQHSKNLIVTACNN